MAGTLQSTVYVLDENGEHVAFGPGDEVPDWAAKQITNKSAWEQAPDAEPGDGLPDGAPPLTGKGSGKAEWVAYATGRGITVPEAASRDDIVDLVRAAG